MIRNGATTLFVARLRPRQPNDEWKISAVAVTLATALTLAGGHNALAQNKAKVERQFQNWLVKEIWPRARAEGVSRRTFNRAFDGVTLNWKLPGLVPPGSPPPKKRKQRQSEFGSPGKYFNSGSVNSASSIGRQMAGKLSDTLARIERQTGVPGRIALAVWGRESAYGRAKIPGPITAPCSTVTSSSSTALGST